MSFKTKSAFLIGLLALLGACTPKQEGQDDPKRRLNEYISQGFAVKNPQDRVQLLSYLTGDAKTRLESWSDEQFRQAFVDSKRQFIRLAFKELKPVSADEVGITYELTYQADYADPEGIAHGSHGAKITNRKLAQLVRQNGQWFISDVRNIREVVEYKDEMDLQAKSSR
jgi:hypothetical protein